MVVPGSANKVVTALIPMLPRGLLLALADLRNRRRARRPAIPPIAGKRGCRDHDAPPASWY